MLGRAVVSLACRLTGWHGGGGLCSAGMQLEPWPGLALLPTVGSEPASGWEGEPPFSKARAEPGTGTNMRGALFSESWGFGEPRTLVGLSHPVSRDLE